nr:DUF2182 domain-containing protein [Salipiger mucosus]
MPRSLPQPGAFRRRPPSARAGRRARHGVDHGLYCLGCCWALMALLFVGGIMNLWWIAGLAAYVLAEKLVPWPRLLAHGTGAALIAFGLWCLATGLPG